MGGNVPSNYIPSVEKGFFEAVEKGTLAGNLISGVRMVLHDGAFHAVNLSELAFHVTATGAFHKTYLKTKSIILKPIMTIKVVAPVKFQSVFLSPPHFSNHGHLCIPSGTDLQAEQVSWDYHG
jgi:elongation factor G